MPPRPTFNVVCWHEGAEQGVGEAEGGAGRGTGRVGSGEEEGGAKADQGVAEGTGELYQEAPAAVQGDGAAKTDVCNVGVQSRMTAFHQVGRRTYSLTMKAIHMSKMLVVYV